MITCITKDEGKGLRTLVSNWRIRTRIQVVGLGRGRRELANVISNGRRPYWMLLTRYDPCWWSLGWMFRTIFVEIFRSVVDGIWWRLEGLFYLFSRLHIYPLSGAHIRVTQGSEGPRAPPESWCCVNINSSKGCSSSSSSQAATYSICTAQIHPTV